MSSHLVPREFAKCRCGIPAKMLTSWTSENPGRRFLNYKFSDVHTGRKGYEYFYWVDEDQVEWQRVVINCLLVEKKLLNNDVLHLKSDLEKVEDAHGTLKAEYAKVDKKLRDELKKKQMSDEQGKMEGFVYGVVAFVSCLITMYFVKLVVNLV